MIEPSQRLNEHIRTLVPKLVPSGNEQIQRFLQIKIEMSVKVSARKFVNFLLCNGMQILKFMNCRKFLHIQSVRRYNVRFPFQQMFCLVAGNLRYGREYMRQMCGGPFDTVSMVDLSFAGFVVNWKFVQIVVKVCVASAQVSAQQCCVRRKNRCNVNPTRTQRNQSDAGLPLVKLGNDSRWPKGLLVSVALQAILEFGQKITDHVAKYDGIVALNVQVWYTWNTAG